MKNGSVDIAKYHDLLKAAIKQFWETRNNQMSAQSEREIKDAGNRGAVTGGKQLDGLLELLYIVATDIGIPAKYIYLKGNQLPGYCNRSLDSFSRKSISKSASSLAWISNDCREIGKIYNTS